MSAGMIGADPQVLRDLATKFDEAAEQLNGIGSSVQVWVDKTDIWRGMDNRRFVGDWQSTGARSVVETAAALRSSAGILRANANAQDSASAAEGAGSGGSGLFISGAPKATVSGPAQPAPGDPSFWNEFLDASNELMDVELFGGESVKDFASFLGSLGLGNNASAAMTIATEMPELVDQFLDPDASPWDSLGAIANIGLDMGGSEAMALGVRTRNPTAILGGVAFMSVGTAVEAAREADFSPSGFETVANYVRENPMSIVEETGKATVKVFSDLGEKSLKAMAIEWLT